MSTQPRYAITRVTLYCIWRLDPDPTVVLGPSSKRQRSICVVVVNSWYSVLARWRKNGRTTSERAREPPSSVTMDNCGDCPMPNERASERTNERKKRTNAMNAFLLRPSVRFLPSPSRFLPFCHHLLARLVFVSSSAVGRERQELLYDP